jgi:hypothetical protein
MSFPSATLVGTLTDTDDFSIIGHHNPYLVVHLFLNVFVQSQKTDRGVERSRRTFRSIQVELFRKDLMILKVYAQAG